MPKPKFDKLINWTYLEKKKKKRKANQLMGDNFTSKIFEIQYPKTKIFH